MTARIDFEIAANADEAVTFDLVDESGASIDLSASSAWQLDVKPAAGGDAALTLEDGDGIDVTDADEGQITVTFPAGGLAAGAYVYDLIRVEDGNKERLFAGLVTVESGTTVIA